MYMYIYNTLDYVIQLYYFYYICIVMYDIQYIWNLMNFLCYSNRMEIYNPWVYNPIRVCSVFVFLDRKINNESRPSRKPT
jgi:hypothetical protein